MKILLAEAGKNLSQVLLTVESTFEIGIVLKDKIEQLTTQKLFTSRKLNIKETNTGGANEHEQVSLKNNVNFIVVPFV